VGDETHERLLELLRRHGADYRLIDHPPEGRTEAVSKLRGHAAREAAKCIVLRVKVGKKQSRYVLAVVPGDRRVDLGAVKALFGGTYAGFADAETAERLAGSVAGTVLPFTLDSNLELIVDPDLLTVPVLYFNAARLNQSVALNAEDYTRIAHPRVAVIAAPPDPPSTREEAPAVPDHARYDIHLDDKFGSLTRIDIAAEAALHEPWFNQTLTQVNNTVVRLGVIEGDFHWHHHENTDEFFLVLDGQLLIDLHSRDTVTLNPHQGFTVPRGIEHRTRAPVRTSVLMIEAAGVVPTGD
jgi:Ala-tRNA(Pro) deacylase